eukprot:TRINITY_DN212_c1_g1_i6.p1 TRINITY_DN212_c1_g1~~TRINITY_DN212_c1_g1_i6.p1  ORF type:complete len:328 (-),score=-33.42 TRINITY_DN212_c1_g1_i6:320-1216(-)
MVLAYPSTLLKGPNFITSVQDITISYLARPSSNIKMSHHMCHIDFGLLKEMRKKGLNIQSSSTCHITLQSTQNDQEKQVQFYNISLRYNYIILSTTQFQHQNVTSHVSHRFWSTQRNEEKRSKHIIIINMSHHTLIYLKRPRKIGLILQHQSNIYLYHTQHDVMLTSKCHITCAPSTQAYLEKNKRSKCNTTIVYNAMQYNANVISSSVYIINQQQSQTEKHRPNHNTKDIKSTSINTIKNIQVPNIIQHAKYDNYQHHDNIINIIMNSQRFTITTQQFVKLILSKFKKIKTHVPARF